MGLPPAEKIGAERHGCVSTQSMDTSSNCCVIRCEAPWLRVHAEHRHEFQLLSYPVRSAMDACPRRARTRVKEMDNGHWRGTNVRYSIRRNSNCEVYQANSRVNTTKLLRSAYTLALRNLALNQNRSMWIHVSWYRWLAVRVWL